MIQPFIITSLFVNKGLFFVDFLPLFGIIIAEIDVEKNNFKQKKKNKV